MSTFNPNSEPFQGPELLPFEFLGYWEELHDVEFNQYLGFRMVDKADRLLGSQGAKYYELTENIELQKGYKTYTLKASKKRPIKVRSMLQIRCGKKLPQFQDDFWKELHGKETAK